MKLTKSTQLSLLVMVLVMMAAVVGLNLRHYAEPGFSYTEALYATDVSDPRQLVGITENVFVGRVVAFSQTHYPDGIPESLFTVEVAENIKGELKGEVVVNQQGGHWQAAEDGTAGELHLVNEDALLVPGQTYLFATLPDAEGRWHTLVPVFGDVLIKDDGARESIVAQYRDAVQNQVPYDAELYSRE